MMGSFFLIVFEVLVMLVCRPLARKHTPSNGKENKAVFYILNAKCFGACAAQMCGAAAVRGFGLMQYQAFHEGSFQLMCGVVPMAAVVILVMMKAMSFFRM